MLTVLSISNFIKPEIRKSADAFGMGWAYAPTHSVCRRIRALCRRMCRHRAPAPIGVNILHVHYGPIPIPMPYTVAWQVLTKLVL